MFGGNSGKGRGSLRKVFYKQLGQTPRPNTSAETSAERDSANEPKPRPPALTFSGPSGTEKCSVANNNNNSHALSVSTPAGIASDGFTLPPTGPKIRSAPPTDSRLDAGTVSVQKRPRFGSVRGQYNPPPDSIANTPLIENMPLSVDVNCACGISSSQSGPPSTRLNDRVGQQYRLSTGQFLGNNNAICRVPGHQHYRSISASPQYNAAGMAVDSQGQMSNAPLLIPLGNSQSFIRTLSSMHATFAQHFPLSHQKCQRLIARAQLSNIGHQSADLFIRRRRPRVRISI